MIYPLSAKFPEFTVTHLTGRKINDSSVDHLQHSMEIWAEKDFAKASAWMDAQIASRTFDAKALDGKNWIRIQYESVLLRTLLTKDGDLLSQRLNQSPPELQQDVIMSIATAWRAYGRFSDKDESAFCKLVRAELPPAQQSEVFMARANQASTDGSSAVDKFLGTIEATSEEQLLCVGKVARSRIAGIAVNRDDIVGLRDWVRTQTLEFVNRFTGEALGEAAGNRGIAVTNYRKMSYAEAAAFAMEFNESSGNDGVLAAFLKSEGGRSNKDQARVLAGKISDENLRMEILITLN